MIFLILFLCLHHVSFALIAYDCNSDILNYTSISLVDLPNCKYRDIKPHVSPSRGIIVQSVKHQNIKAYFCSVTILRKIQICDFWSNDQANTADIGTIIPVLSRTECLVLHETKKYQYRNSDIIENIPINSSYHCTRVMAGKTSYRGQCEGTDYSDEHGKWENVQVNGDFEIKLLVVNGVLNIGDNSIRFQSGLTCPFSNEVCTDHDGFTYVWSNSFRERCDRDVFESLYVGGFDIIEYDESTAVGKKYLVVNNTKTYITLKLHSQLYICNIDAYETNVDGVSVLLWTSPGIPDFLKHINPLDVSINLQYLVKLTGVDVHLYQELSGLYSNMIYNDCIQERETLKIKMHIGYTDPVEFAYLYNDGPGATAITAGQAIYFAKCPPVRVEVRRTDICYKEIPVLYGNNTIFVNPKTRIIQEFGSPIPCSTIYNILIKENDVWYSLYPKTQRVDTPNVLDTLGVYNWTYKTLSSIIAGGVYTQEDLSKSREALLYPYTYQSVDHMWVDHILKTSVTGTKIDITSLPEITTLKSWVTSKLEYAWGFFKMIGNIANGMLGIYVVYRAIDYIISCLLHGMMLFDIFGLSWKIVGAIFSTVGNFFIHREHRKHTRIFMDYLERTRNPTYGENTNDQNINICQTGKSETIPLYPTIKNVDGNITTESRIPPPSMIPKPDIY